MLPAVLPAVLLLSAVLPAVLLLLAVLLSVVPAGGATLNVVDAEEGPVTVAPNVRVTLPPTGMSSSIPPPGSAR